MNNIFHVKKINDQFITVEYKLGAVLTGGFKVIDKVGVTKYTVSNGDVTIGFDTFAAHGGVDNFVIRYRHDKMQDRMYWNQRYLNKYHFLVKGFHDTLMFKWNHEMKELLK
jgi:hypothetical protein